MTRVALLTSRCMLRGHPNMRVDHWEHELQMAALAPACADREIELVEAVWDDPRLDPDLYDACVIGTTWDYTDAPQAFLEFLGRAAATTRVFNSPRTVRWNLDKRYLAELERSGAPVVPTLWCDRADRVTIESSFADLGADVVVVKPVVGASAWRQVKLARGEPLPPPDELPPAEALVQPYLPAAETEGEYSFVFFGRRFSHCAQKIPAAGDYRVQSMYGAKERIHRPSPAEVERATSVLDAVDEPLLYARVDMMRGLDGRLVLMELELIEPYLYPEQGPDMGPRFASTLSGLLAG